MVLARCRAMHDRADNVKAWEELRETSFFKVRTGARVLDDHNVGTLGFYLYWQTLILRFCI